MSALSLLYRGRLGPDRVKNDVLYRDCVSNRTPLCSILATNFSAKLGVHVILASCVCAYLFIIYYFSGGLPISNDPSRSIYSYRARQPPFLTSVTSIFGHNVDLVRIYLYIIYIIYILYMWFYILGFIWSLVSLWVSSHTIYEELASFSSICPKDADSLRYIYLSWLLNGFYNGVPLPGTVLNPLAAIP